MPRPGRDWTDAERIIILDDYLQSLSRSKTLGEEWIANTSTLLDRSRGSVNLKRGNFVYARTEVLGLPKAGMKGRALRDTELFREWHQNAGELHGVADEIRASLGTVVARAHDERRRIPDRFFEWLQHASREDLETESASRAQRTRQLESEGGTTAESSGTRREGQKEFKEAALIDFVLCAGTDLLRSCPGCGHSRTRFNGDPILDVHHVVPFARTLAMDPRWGVPLCKNCHAVAHTGSPADRRTIYANVIRVFPQLLNRLQELYDGGQLSTSHAVELREVGLDIQSRASRP
jgi:hypothetical protein